MRSDSNNMIFQLAADFVNNTSRHIFLTGKAGTGKTTFLKHIQSGTRKNCVVIAPTGVAAINAGGVTMHSFFQLPFTPFIPGESNNGNPQVVTINSNKTSFFKNKKVHFRANKLKLLRKLELLIIDEISMVRSDTLDAIDTLLREARKQPQLPFGGVQVLYIGDMYQLPPVASEAEWELLGAHYASPFFFDAKVIQEAPPLYIELKKIYRQSDEHFINILNRVRTNTAGNEHLQLLNSRYLPDFVPPQEDKYIILTTHNNKADNINTTELNKLPGILYSFRGELSGEFNENSLPADLVLNLKEGAQVIFIKNDKGENRRYYNGKLATVKKLNKEGIVVIPVGSTEEITLEKETWKNIHYRLNETGREIVEEELGTFKQYPIRLAWAVTIHKSQGLTFEKAIIDAGQAFAAGQVYVALSRCTSLEGIVLHSRIGGHNINTDYRVVEFARKEASQEYLEPTLSKEKKTFELSQLIRLFDWNSIVDALRQWQEDLPKRKIEKKGDAVFLTYELTRKAVQQQQVAVKFQRQLEIIGSSLEEKDGMEKLKDRMNKSINHFSKALNEELVMPLQEHADYIKKLKQSKAVKSYLQELAILQTLLWDKIYNLWNAAFGGDTFNEGLQEYKRYSDTVGLPTASDVVSEKITTKGKQPAGTTRLESLRQFQEGKTIDDIAKERNLAKSTIEGHLAESIGLGEVEIEKIMDAERIALILPVVQKLGYVSLSPIRLELGEGFTFTEIRMVAQHVKRTEQLMAPS